MLTVSNANNQFIKLESGLITAFFSTISPPFNNVEIVGNVNCCGTNSQLNTNTTVLANGSKWNVDLDTPTRLGETIRGINFKNMKTGIVYPDFSITNIDLGYVEDNCVSNGCTLEDFSNYFVPIFTTGINNFLLSVGAPQTAVITFDGNILEVAGLPSPFILTDIIYGDSIPRISVLSSFGDTNSEAFLVDNALWLTPLFFGYEDGKMKDGVYSIDLKFSDLGGNTASESNCAFIDVTTKCKVAGTIKNLLEEYEKGKTDSISAIVHTLHYALVNGSNCGCNCGELCQVYTELFKILSEHSDIINVDCGCQV